MCDTTSGCNELLYNTSNNECKLYPSGTNSKIIGTDAYDKVYLYHK